MASLLETPLTEERPWGCFTVLDEAPGYKVKRIEVRPGRRLSYQVHQRRAEHWFVVEGTARVTIDDEPRVLEAGQVAEIPIGSAHRLESIGVEDLILIEVQRGDYLGEDDIIRLADDFGRAEA